MRSHFSVLGVPESASDKDVRAAFVRRAKQLHPDLNRTLSVEQAKEQFIELKAAYDCVIDAQQRKAYVEELRRQQFQHVTEPLRRAEWAKKRPRWPKHRRHERDARASPINLSSAMQVWQNSKWEEFVKELEGALTMAYWGPVFDGGEDEYPDYFEAEERSDLHHAHVLQVVSGRQLLGWVQTCSYTPLPSPTLTYLFGKEYDEQAALLQKQLPATEIDKLVAEAAEHEHRQHRRHAHGGRHNQSSSASNWAGMRFPNRDDFQAFKQAFAPEADDEVVDEVLELQWQGSLAARGHRRVSKKHRDWHAIQFEVLQDNNWVVTCHLTRMPSVLGRHRYVFLNCNMEETHRVVTWWTPGVHHAHIFNRQGFCETKLSKARLPSSKYWLFEPREATHDVGGWYFERHPLSHHAETTLHPSVGMLWAGFRTMDHQHAKLLSLSARANSWFRTVRRAVVK